MEPTSPGDVRGASTGPPSGPSVEMPGEVVVDGGTVLTVTRPPTAGAEPAGRAVRHPVGFSSIRAAAVRSCRGFSRSRSAGRRDRLTGVVRRRIPRPVPGGGTSRVWWRVTRDVGSLALAVVLLIWGLPKVAGVGWAEIIEPMRTLNPVALGLLALLQLCALFAFTFTITGALPGITHRQALTVNLAGSLVANTLPFGGALGDRGHLCDLPVVGFRQGGDRDLGVARRHLRHRREGPAPDGRAGGAAAAGRAHQSCRPGRGAVRGADAWLPCWCCSSR